MPRARAACADSGARVCRAPRRVRRAPRRRLRALARRVTPAPVWSRLRRAYFEALRLRYRWLGRPPRAGETAKAAARRRREGFFERYCRGHGLDVGYGGDLLTPDCVGFDVEDGDAQTLAGVPDESFDFVHSSHTLEHVERPDLALRSFWRVLRPGGHLILYLPHRDLYEKRATLPSRWNSDHKHYFLVDRDEPPVTLGVVALLERTLPEAELVYAVACSEGHTIRDPDVHSDGEYSIELVARKPAAAGRDADPSEATGAAPPGAPRGARPGSGRRA